jgi:hypothetical protein
MAILAAVMLLATVAQQARPAHAAATIVTLADPGQQGHLVGTSVGGAVAVGAATDIATFTAVTAFAAGSFVNVTFVSGTTTNASNIAGSDFLMTCAGGGTDIAVVTATASSNAISILVPVGITGTGACAIRLSTTAAGNEIINPTTPTSAGSFTITTSATAFGTAIDTGTIATVVILGFNLTASTSSIAADGIGTVLISVTTANAAGTATAATGAKADVVTIQTSAGTFIASANSAAFSGVTPTLTTSPSTTARATTTVGGGNSGVSTFTLLTPTTTGTAVVNLYVTPVGGGTPPAVGLVTITLTTAVSYGGVTAVTATVSREVIPSTSTSTVTATFVDASNNPPVAVGATVTATTTLGSLTALTNGANVGSQVVVGTIPAGGIWAVTLTGGGVGGVATVTINSDTVSVSKTVSLVGVAATISLSTAWSNTTSGLLPKTILQNIDSSTSNRDELLVVAVVKDSTGAYLAGGNVTFALPPSGASLVFSNAYETAGFGTTTACSEGGTGTTTCVDAIEAAAGGSIAIPAAVAYLDEDAASLAPDPTGKYTIKASFTNPDGSVITATATFTMGKTPAKLTAGAAPAVVVGATATYSILVQDADGNPAPQGTSIGINVSNVNLFAQDPVAGTTGTSVAVQVLGADGKADVTLIGIQPGATQVIANFGTLTAITTVTVGGGTTAPPTEPGAIGTGGLLCFTYSGPAKAVADFLAFFNAAVDGVNIQMSSGTYSSWFRALSSAATVTSLSSGDRVCASGPTGSRVFA